MQTYKTGPRITLLIIVLLIATTTHATINSLITDYHQIIISCFNGQKQLRIAIRMYYRDTIPYYIVVNPYNFKTETAPTRNYSPRIPVKNAPGYFKFDEIQNTPYVKALNKYTLKLYTADNYGIIRFD